MFKRFKVCIRRRSLEVRPEAEQIDGNTYNFRYGWEMEEGDPYPGEQAWIADDSDYPDTAPVWVSSGDLKEQ